MIQSRKARHVRARIVGYLDWLYLRRIHLGYAMARPMRSYPTRYEQLPEHDTDCSESSAIVLEASGAPPVFKVGPLCYTGTFLSQCKHIPKRFTRRGDAVVICTAAEPMGAHMVLLLQGGMWRRDPLVWSHGRPGADVMPLSQMLEGFPTRTRVVYLRTVPLNLK
jgi:hypothetical protein